MQTIVGRITPQEQVQAVRAAQRIAELAPPEKMVTPYGLMKVAYTSAGECGWVSSRAGYSYQPNRSSGDPWPTLPDLFLDIARRFGGPAPYNSALLGWYDDDAILGAHRDRIERCSYPVVTLSLGYSARWFTIGEDGQQTSDILETGDVTCLSGPTRMRPHGISAIYPSPLLRPAGLSCRIMVSVRVARLY